MGFDAVAGGNRWIQMEDPRFPFRAIVSAALDAAAVKTDVSDVSAALDASAVRSDISDISDVSDVSDVSAVRCSCCQD